MEFLRGIFSSLNEYLDLGLDISLPFFPTFTVVGWLVGTTVLVLRYTIESKKQYSTSEATGQDNDVGSKWPRRLVLMYDIITMTFLAIGVGISLTILERVNRQSGQECGEWTCEELVAGIGGLQRKIEILENSLDVQQERNGTLQERLIDLVTRPSSDWMTIAAEKILERRNDDSMTGPVASEIIREEFFRYFDDQ